MFSYWTIQIRINSDTQTFFTELLLLLKLLTLVFFSFLLFTKFLFFILFSGYLCFNSIPFCWMSLHSYFNKITSLYPMTIQKTTALSCTRMSLLITFLLGYIGHRLVGLLILVFMTSGTTYSVGIVQVSIVIRIRLWFLLLCESVCILKCFKGLQKLQINVNTYLIQHSLVNS